MDQKISRLPVEKGHVMPEQYRDRIAFNPSIMTGKPVIRGTRIPVALIVQMVAQNIPTDEILDDYPQLEWTDIQAALWYAVSLLNQEEVHPLLVEVA